MKKMKLMALMAMSMIFAILSCVIAAYAADPAEIVTSAWKKRHADVAVENTIWEMRDYALVDKACTDRSVMSCYAPTEVVNTFAQSLDFNDSGSDGVWTHFFDGDTAKGKGLVMRLNGANLANSNRHFCRAMSAVDRVRAIRVAPTNQVSIDPAITVSWAIVMTQTGVTNYAQASYSAVENPPHRVPGTAAVRVTVPNMPVYIAYVDEEQQIMRRIDLLDAQGNVAWVVENRATKNVGVSWTPSDMFIINVKEGRAVMLQEVTHEKKNFKEWPKNYTARDLPCGQ